MHVATGQQWELGLLPKQGPPGAAMAAGEGQLGQLRGLPELLGLARAAVAAGTADTAGSVGAAWKVGVWNCVSAGSGCVVGRLHTSPLFLPSQINS